MEAQKIITLIVAGLLALSIGTALIQVLIKRLKLSDREQTMSLSYTLFISGLFVAYGMVVSKTLQLLVPTLDVLYRANGKNLVWESLKSCTVFLGCGIIWYIAGYIVSNLLLSLITVKQDTKSAIEENNYPYILARCFIFISFIIIFNPILEKFLTLFIPVIEAGIYH